MTTTTDLIPLPAEQPAIVALFSKPENVDAIISEIEAKVADFIPDMTTSKGRDECRSLAAKVARSKTALDRAGKELNEAARAQINAVDAERRKIRERLDDLKDRVRKPLTEWEEAEEKRKADMTQRLADITADGFSALTPSATIRERISHFEAVEVDESWAEFQDDARFALDTTLHALRTHLVASEQREKDERELEALRREKAERDAKEAAERAERERVERERAEAIAAEEARREAERRRQIEEEQRAAQIAEAAERAKVEAEERARREVEEANRRAEKAAAAERARIEAEKQAEEAERARREKSKRIRAEKAKQIATALRGIEPFTPESVAEALLDRKVPHIHVEF